MTSKIDSLSINFNPICLYFLFSKSKKFTLILFFLNSDKFFKYSLAPKVEI